MRSREESPFTTLTWSPRWVLPVSIFAAYVAEFGIKRTRSCEDLEPRSGGAFFWRVVPRPAWQKGREFSSRRAIFLEALEALEAKEG